ncbi:hypothetical protein LXL04_034300 [Taraxacum kok-saghyz]
MWVVGKSGGTMIKPSFDEEFEAEIKMTDTFDRDDNNDFVASRHESRSFENSYIPENSQTEPL